MTLPSSSSPTVICAENIALLYLLHQVPVPPSCNELVEAPCRHGNYSLSFTQERNLASTLAFLSNTRGDPNYVTALCIEEDPDSTSLRVMLAVNKAKWEDGNQVLRGLKQSLDDIFVVLSEISDGGNKDQDLEHRVFTAIIHMCYHRILSRMRFVAKDRGNPKQPFKVVLGEAVNSLQKVGYQTAPSLSAGTFIKRAKDVVRLVDSWSKHQKATELEKLVEGIYQLKRTGDLQALMDSVPNRDMCPSSRRNLVNIVSKVSRYREAARFLYSAARKLPLLRRTKVGIISLPEQIFDRSPHQDHTPDLVSAISRTSTMSQGANLGNLCRLLNATRPQLNNLFNAQTSKTLREAKIHAEIQLVFYYELTAARSPPRVVCSSKDACFLCNAFILMHGKMHMPRYHGRLYPGWRLPLIPNLGDLNSIFNTVLERQIEDSFKLMFSRHKKTVYPDPNESTLLTLPLSTSTLRTSISVEAARWERIPTNTHMIDHTAEPSEPSVPQEGRVLAESSRYCKSPRSVLGPRNRDQVEASTPHLDSPDQPVTRLSSRTSPRYTLSSDGVADTAELVQGVPQVGDVAIAREPKFHTAGVLDIHIEYIAEVASSTDKSCSEMSYCIEWLSDEESKELLEDDVAAVVDVEALQSQISHKLGNDNGLTIMAGGVLVRITPRNRFTI